MQLEPHSDFLANKPVAYIISLQLLCSIIRVYTSLLYGLPLRHVILRSMTEILAGIFLIF